MAELGVCTRKSECGVAMPDLLLTMLICGPQRVD